MEWYCRGCEAQYIFWFTKFQMAVEKAAEPDAGHGFSAGGSSGDDNDEDDGDNGNLNHPTVDDIGSECRTVPPVGLTNAELGLGPDWPGEQPADFGSDTEEEAEDHGTAEHETTAKGHAGEESLNRQRLQTTGGKSIGQETARGGEPVAESQVTGEDAEMTEEEEEEEENDDDLYEASVDGDRNEGHVNPESEGAEAEPSSGLDTANPVPHNAGTFGGKRLPGTDTGTGPSSNTTGAGSNITPASSAADPAGRKKRQQTWTEQHHRFVADLMQELVNRSPKPGEKERYRTISDRLRSSGHRPESTPDSVKNYWNRVGRAKSGIEERRGTKDGKVRKLKTAVRGPKEEKKAGSKGKSRKEPKASTGSMKGTKGGRKGQKGRKEEGDSDEDGYYSVGGESSEEEEEDEDWEEEEDAGLVPLSDPHNHGPGLKRRRDPDDDDEDGDYSPREGSPPKRLKEIAAI